MFLAEFLFVLVLALVFTCFFALAGGRYLPWPGLVWLFMILLMATWALGVWFRPVGPPVRGFYWGSFVAAVVVVSLLLAAAVSRSHIPRKKTREELKGVEIRPLTPAEQRVREERAEAAATACFGVLFWVLIAVALAAVVVHYAFPDFT